MIPVVYYESSTRMSLGKRPEAVKPCLEGDKKDFEEQNAVQNEKFSLWEKVQHSRLLECAIILA
jgi:hypothetical protein